MRHIIQHGTVITPHGVRPHHTVVTEGTRIVAVCPDAEFSPASSPGFVDVHIHGIGGHDTMDATPQAIAAMSRQLAEYGVTSFLPTTVTAPHDDLLRQVRNVADAMARPPAGARPLGVHLEGPYISAEKRGAQPTDSLRLPDSAELETYLSAGPVKIITLAPELPGAEALVRRAVAQGVRASLGHTTADYDQVRAALSWGISHASHTFNAMSGLHHRRPGAAGAVLTCDQLYAEIIADFVHTHPAIVDLVVRAKGVARTVLVSDAMRAAGLPDGQYALGSHTVTVRDGAPRLADGTLAGSRLTLDQALRNVINVTGLTLAEALPMATSVPAAAIGLADTLGALVPGHRADVVLLDAKQHVTLTLVGGQVVYRAQD
jgi:N-acetylglucosamine-6-phosphate deacetylase